MRTASILPLLAQIAVSACTGSPATLAMRPDFQVTTPAGPASVSIRETPSGMTFSRFEQAVRTAMESEMLPDPQAGPTPAPLRRIVWHVSSTPARGISRLVVNVFDGSTPFAYAQETIDNDAPIGTIADAASSMLHRLDAALDQRNESAHG